MKQKHFFIPEKLIRELKRKAKVLGVTEAEAVRRAIRAYVRQQEIGEAQE